MPKVVEGQLSSAGKRFAIVAGRFNSLIVDRLVEGAVDAIVRTGGDEGNITVYYAPGAFEIPQVLRWVLDAQEYDAVICLGAVIRGGTPHFEYVANAVTKGVSDLAYSGTTPVAFGVLTCDSIEQAIERAGTKAGNKGNEAAMAAIEMTNLADAFERTGGRAIERVVATAVEKKQAEGAMASAIGIKNLARETESK